MTTSPEDDGDGGRPPRASLFSALAYTPRKMDDNVAEKLRDLEDAVARLRQHVQAESGAARLNRELRAAGGRGDLSATLRELQAEASAEQADEDARAEASGRLPEKIRQPSVNDALRRATGRG
jgi:hypothetical protein